MSDSAKCGLSAMQDPRRTELDAMRELAAELARALEVAAWHYKHHTASDAIPPHWAASRDSALGHATLVLGRARSAGLLP